MSLRVQNILLSFLILATGVEFGLRGPLRAVRSGREWNDFLSPYIQARAWRNGQDPYDANLFVSNWPPGLHRPTFVAHEAADGSLIAKRGIPSPYPLTSFVLLAPVSLLSWSTAQSVWMALNLAAFALSLASLVSLAGLTWKESRAQLFLAIALALAPFHTGFATGNPTVLVVSISVIAIWAANRKWSRTAGILLGAAVCLKPQVGLCFVVYYLVRRRWNIATIALGSTAAISLVAVSRLALSGTPWLATYIQDTRNIFAPGAINDFTPLNPVWYNMINLQVVLWQLVKSVSVANLLSLLVGGMLFAIWLWLVIRRGPKSELLEISSLVVLSLLPVYHRFYDAALLIFPLAWAVMAAKEHHRRVALVTLGCILPFLIPGATLLNQLAAPGRIPVAITTGPWWNAFAMPHEVWALIVLAFLLLYTMATLAATEATSRAFGDLERVG